MNRSSLVTALALSFAMIPSSAFAIDGMRLIGITGNQGNAADETLYEIDTTAHTISPIIKLPFIPDTDAIAFNPFNGLLYRTSGSTSYSNNPTSNGYRDNYFMQTVDVVGGTLDQAAVFNANSEQFGLPGPRPSWVVPAERRTDAQNTDAFQIQGPNEYHSIRDFTWSSSDCAFFGADEDGIYRLSLDGDSTKVGAPGGQPKGITFATIDGARSLYLSDRDSPELWKIDPATGEHLGAAVMVKHPTTPGAFVAGLLSIVAIPDQELLYGILNVPGSPNARQLITIDPVTGDSSTVMALNTYMADLAIVYDTPAIGDLDADGFIGRADAARFASVFGLQSNLTSSIGDLNCDGKTSLDDLAILQSKLGSVASPEVAAAVPEPSTLSAALLGVLMVAAKRCARGRQPTA
jgi:hypothetical protein